MNSEQMEGKDDGESKFLFGANKLFNNFFSGRPRPMMAKNLEKKSRPIPEDRIGLRPKFIDENRKKIFAPYKIRTSHFQSHFNFITKIENERNYM
jgi:hypothetical protein